MNLSISEVQDTVRAGFLLIVSAVKFLAQFAASGPEVADAVGRLHFAKGFKVKIAAQE